MQTLRVRLPVVAADHPFADTRVSLSVFVDIPDKDGNTFLHHIVRNTHTEIFDHLLTTDFYSPSRAPHRITTASHRFTDRSADIDFVLSLCSCVVSVRL
jgi:hypothetical protein